jgi:hypothetical protein
MDPAIEMDAFYPIDTIKVYPRQSTQSTQNAQNIETTETTQPIKTVDIPMRKFENQGNPLDQELLMLESGDYKRINVNDEKCTDLWKIWVAVILAILVLCSLIIGFTQLYIYVYNRF